MNRTKAWGTAVSAAVLVLVGCSAQGTARPVEKPRANGAPVVADSVEQGRTAVTGAPKLDGKTLVSAAARTGDAEYPIPGGVRAGGMLVVAFECEGAGRLTVDVVHGGTTFTVPCEKGKVVPFVNETEMSRTDPTATLHFTAGPGVTWAFAAGWDNSGRMHDS
ncbi:MAG TPA: hypothetical protein VIU15_10100 [Streptomyces sp.]